MNSLKVNANVNQSMTISGPGNYGVVTPNITLTLANWTLWTQLGMVVVKDLTGMDDPNITVLPFPGGGGSIDDQPSATINESLQSLILLPFLNGVQWISIASGQGTPPVPTAPVNISLPVISGSTVVGQTLTASNGTWTQSPTSFAYQWLSNGSPISGATASAFTLGSGNVGANISVTVTATNATGSTPATSSSVGPVTSGAVAPANTVLPAITGATVVGSTLTASQGTWTGSPTSFAFQWLAAGTPISGATASTFVPGSGDIGLNISVTVTATNGTGSTPATSTSVGPITSGATAPANTVLPAITGSPVVGSTLTASDGTWTGSPTSFTFQWSNGSPISGATASTYVPVSGDVGLHISVTVTATNGTGSTPATSTSVGPVTSSGGSNPSLDFSKASNSQNLGVI